MPASRQHRSLATPGPGRDAAEAFVATHFRHLVCDDIVGSSAFAGGQSAADAALNAFDVLGYAGQRNEVLPRSRRGASALSPYIRHGLLILREVWDRVGDGPSRDVSKFRDELLWQEFARHWYARLGHRTRRGVRIELRPLHPTENGATGWDTSMACMAATVDELHEDGWLVNQTRMWLSSHWAIRQGLDWRDGEDRFFQHLLDGSRAANRLGWQWTTGVGSSKHYGFSRYQVEKRAPELCRSCALADMCPIEEWPNDPQLDPIEAPAALRTDVDPTATSGPPTTISHRIPAAVWLTAEMLGDADPALVAHPELPVIFVFDEPLLHRLQLSSKRLIFLTETLAELATRRSVELHLGDPVDIVDGRDVAVTFAPVPGFQSRVDRIDLAELHPWPWLERPRGGSVQSFSAWRS